MARKTPVLLTRSPLTKRAMVLTNYKRLDDNPGGRIQVQGDGKHDVSADYDVMLLEDVMGPPGDSENTAVMDMLATVAEGSVVLPHEKATAERLWKRLNEVIQRHNERVEAKDAE